MVVFSVAAPGGPCHEVEAHVWPDRRRYVSCGVVSRPAGGNPVYRLSWAGSPGGVREHIEMMYGAQRAPGTKIEMLQTK